MTAHLDSCVVPEKRMISWEGEQKRYVIKFEFDRIWRGTENMQ